MKERILAIIGTVTGTGTTVMGTTADTEMLSITPFFQNIAIIFGGILSVLMSIYWAIKIYEKIFKGKGGRDE